MVHAKSETVDIAYLETLDNYIGAEIALAVKYAIPVLDKVKNEKVMQIILQLEMPIKTLSLTLAFMNFISLMVRLRNTMLMSSLKT